jgi:hypothetical protein
MSNRRVAGDGSVLADAPAIPMSSEGLVSNAQLGVERRVEAAKMLTLPRRHIAKPQVFAIVDEKFRAVTVRSGTVTFMRDQKLLSQRKFNIAVENGVKIRDVHPSLRDFKAEVVELLKAAELTEADAEEIKCALQRAVKVRNIRKETK